MQEISVFSDSQFAALLGVVATCGGGLIAVIRWADVDTQKTVGTTTRYLALDYTAYIKQLRQDRAP